MPWSGGSFTRTNGVHTGATLWAQDRDAGTKILATRHDTHDQDLADGINSTLEKSGSNAATGNLNIGSNRLTAVADGTAKTDAATVNQIQSNAPAFQATDTGTANAYVIALSPAVTAYAAGQAFTFKAGAASTTASTLNVNGLGTKAIKKLHDQDIASGDIESGSIVTVVYDGTNFQMTSQVATTPSSGAPAASTSAKTSAYTVVAGDDGSTILCSAASADYAVALTAAATLGDGFTVTLKKSDATKFMITINPNGSETIDGLPDLKLRNEHSEVTLICDGSNWHIISHENVAIEYNAAGNPSFLVDQYDHNTRTGLITSSATVIDRWKAIANSSPSARWTMSVEDNGGVDAESKWWKWLCTTADASPGVSEEQHLEQTILGNDMVGVGFNGSDGKFENAVLSMDIIGHLDTPDAPYTAAIGVKTIDGTQRQYVGQVTIDADAVFQRVHLVIPEDGTAIIEPGTDSAFRITVSLYGGANRHANNNTWEASATQQASTSGSQNWASATDNYVGITNIKLQPGQISTPFIPRPYAEELDICQFYAEKFSYDVVSAEHITTGVFRDNNTMHSIFEWAPKRTTPSISSSAAATFEVREHDGTATDASAIAFDTIGSRTCRFDCTTTGTPGTAGQGAWVIRDGTDTTYIFIDAAS